MTCSNENRYLLARTAGSDIFGDLVDDPHGLFIGGLECVIGDVCTFVFVGVELLSETIFVIPDENVRALEHVQIGRAWCRERVCQYVSMQGADVSIKKIHQRQYIL